MLESNNKKTTRQLVLLEEYLCVTNEATVCFCEKAEVLLLANHFYENGNLEETINVVALGLKQFPQAAELYVFKATLLIEQGQEPEIVVTYLDRALEFAPNDPRVLLLKVEVLCNNEQFEEADALLEFLHDYAQGQEMEQVLLLKAFIHDHQDEFNEMFDLLAEVLQRNPRNVEALTQMWLATAYSERYDESVLVHEAVLEEDPYSFQAWQNLGHAHAGLKNYEEAVFAYEYATITKPDYELAYLDWALCCTEMGRFEEALSVYKEIEQLFGADAELQTKLGVCYQQLDNYLAASMKYASALESDFENHEAHYRMGECLMIQCDYKAAILAFNRAIKIRPQLEEYHLGLAKAYEMNGDLKNAEQAYSRLVEVAPEEPKHWMYQADFYCNIKQFGDALEILEIAELNISRNAYLLYHRAVCFFRMGQRQNAMLSLQEALLEDYALHSRIFDAIPHLEKDRDVLDLIRTFR